MKRLLALTILLTMAFGYAFVMGDNNINRTILVIPFSRFEFHTEIELATINEVNELSGDQFYPLMINMFRSAFELNSTERILYKNISEKDLADISIYLRYDLIPGKGHYTCNLNNLNKKTLKEILDKYECENFLTINWYRILKDKTSSKKKGIKMVSMYSSHYIDYDLFTREGTIIRQGSRLKIEVSADSANRKYKGLRLQDLKPEYKKLVDEISAQILSVD